MLYFLFLKSCLHLKRPSDVAVSGSADLPFWSWNAHRAVLYRAVAAAFAWTDRPLPRADCFAITAHVEFTSIHCLITLVINRKKCATHQFQPQKKVLLRPVIVCFVSSWHWKRCISVNAYVCVYIYTYLKYIYFHVILSLFSKSSQL